MGMPTFIVNKGEDNIVCPTLVEKSLIAVTFRFYIWVIENDQTHEKKYFKATEESTELQRYNKFTVTEKANPDQMNGEVELSVGTHSYKVYEIHGASLVVLQDLADADFDNLTLVEQGFVKCIDPNAVADTQYPDLSLTNTVYPDLGN